MGRKGQTNTTGQQFITSSVIEANGRFVAHWAVGSRSGVRVCETRDEAKIFIQNGIRVENGFSPLGAPPLDRDYTR